MMKKLYGAQKNHKRQRRAVSSVIGGLFVLAIMVAGVSTILYISTLQSGVIQAENRAASADTLKNQERLTVNQVYLGGTQTYTPTQAYVTGSTCNSLCGANMTVASSGRFGSTTMTQNNTLYHAYAPFNFTSPVDNPTLQAISNSNFTSNTNGWTFSSTSSVSGAFTSSNGNPSPGSGAGAIDLYFSCTGNGAAFIGNASARFYINPSTSGGGVGVIAKSLFSWAEYIPVLDSRSISGTTLTLYLIDENTAPSFTWYTLTQLTPSGPDSSWNYRTSISSLQSGGTLASKLVHTGYYDVVINLKVQTTKFCSGQYNFYFDDVGLNYVGSSYFLYQTDWAYTFVLAQSASTVTQLSFSLTTAYNQTSPTQSVYLYDWVNKQYDLFSNITTNVGADIITVNVNFNSTLTPQNLINGANELVLRVQSIAYGTSSSVHRLETDVQSSAYLSITVWYSSSSAVAFSLQNQGPAELEVVSLVIIDASGHHYFNSTTSPAFDVIVYPGKTLVAQVQYSWTAGQSTFYFVTARGNVFVH